MMAALSLTKAEMDAIRFAADMVDSFREGADEDVVANWPMAELGKVKGKDACCRPSAAGAGVVKGRERERSGG